MSALSDYLEGQIAQFVFKNNAAVFATPGDSLYLALFTSDAGLETGVITSEVTPVEYDRFQIVAANWTQTGGAVSNTAEVAFVVATESWGTITHAAIMDAATAGNVLYHAALNAPRAIGIGDQLKFAAGDIAFTHA